MANERVPVAIRGDYVIDYSSVFKGGVSVHDGVRAGARSGDRPVKNNVGSDEAYGAARNPLPEQNMLPGDV